MKMLIILLVLISCGKKDDAPQAIQGPQGKPGISKPCSVVQNSNGAQISCPDGTTAVLENGVQGLAGTSCTVQQTANGLEVSCPNGTTATIQNGQPGANGSSCTTQQLVNGAKIVCTDGSFAFVYNGINGSNGGSCSVAGTISGAQISCDNGTNATLSNGINGINGVNGLNGTGCTTQQLVNGVKVTCGISIGYIYDGEDAVPSAYNVVEVINPCGVNPGFNEVLLRMGNGQIIAHYAGGNNLQFLTILTPGNYVTTDITPCNFNVSNSMVVTW